MQARSRVTEHVGSGPRRQVEFERCGFPDLVTPVRHANTSPCRRGEYRRLGIGRHVRLKVIPQLTQDRGRHLDDPGPMGLRILLNQPAPMLADAPFDGQASQIVEVPPPQRHRLPWSQPAVGQHEDKGAPPRIDGLCEGLHLLGRQGVAGAARGHRETKTRERIAGNDAGIECRVEDHARHRAGAVDGGVRVPGAPELSEPLLHVDPTESPQPTLAQMGQHIQPQCTLVTRDGARRPLAGGDGGPPALGPLTERDASRVGSRYWSVSS